MKGKKSIAIEWNRFLFSLVIAVFHMSAQREFFPNTYVVSEYFFIVTGFLTIKSVVEMDGKETEHVTEMTVRFLKKKFISLLPYSIFAFVMSIPVLWFTERWKLVEAAKNILYGIPEMLFLGESGLKFVTYNRQVWYISAMLIALAIIYPMMVKDVKRFLYVLTPVGTALLYGFIYHHFWNGFIAGPYESYFILRGTVIRALAGLLLGCLMYALCQAVERRDVFCNAFWHFMELAGYLFMLAYAAFASGTVAALEHIAVYCLGISVMVSFSKYSLFKRLKILGGGRKDCMLFGKTEQIGFL